MLIQKFPKLKASVLEECKGYIHTEEQVKNVFKVSPEDVKELSKTTKLQPQIIRYLIDLIIYSHLESKTSNPRVHSAY